MHPLDELEISNIDIQETQQQCFLLLQNEQCSQFNLLKRLCRMELVRYFFIAMIGLGIVLGTCVLLPDVHMNIILFYFFLLGVLASDELYKQRVCNMEELLRTVPINTGKCFLYKCVLCSLLQFGCFLVIMWMETVLFERSYTVLLLHSIVPIYLILSIVMLCERWIHSRFGVLTLYLVSYAVYFSLLSLLEQAYLLNETFFLWYQTWSPLAVCVSCISIFSIIVWYHTKQNTKEVEVIWNFS